MVHFRHHSRDRGSTILLPRWFQMKVVRRIRWRVWRVRCRLGWAAIVSLPQFDNKRLVIPAPSLGRAAALYVDPAGADPSPELLWLSDKLNQGDVAIDVGANLGEWTFVLADAVGESGRVLAIEPALETWTALAQSIELNELAHVTPCRVALSHVRETARLYHHQEHATKHSLGPVGGDGEEVAVRTLDDLLRDESVTRCDALKIDVEGAEEWVLRGAMQTLKRSRPIVVFEVNPNATARLGLAADGAWNILSSLNYRFFALGDRGLRRLTTFTPPQGKSTSRNIIALT